MKRSVGIAAVCAALGCAAVAPAATSPTKTHCPSASLVGSELGVSVKAPTSMIYATYAKTCSYAGTTGQIPIRVEFQVDTPSTFAASENAVTGIGIVKIKGLGQAAWTTKVGGAVYVYSNGETVKVVATPLIALPKLEALARKLL
jgi:hypothetical protein